MLRVEGEHEVQREVSAAAEQDRRPAAVLDGGADRLADHELPAGRGPQLRGGP